MEVTQNVMLKKKKNINQPWWRWHSLPVHSHHIHIQPSKIEEVQDPESSEELELVPNQEEEVPEAQKPEEESPEDPPQEPTTQQEVEEDPEDDFWNWGRRPSWKGKDD